MNMQLQSTQAMNVAGTNPGLHAHLLAMELGGKSVRETPEEVMREVVFRATHVSSLMEEMFRDAEKHNLWKPSGIWDLK